MPRRGVILDRDGTIIDFHRDAELGAVTSAFHPAQIRLLPGAVEGMAALRDAGFVIAIATNQPGAAKGQIPWSAIERTNLALVEDLAGRGIPIAAVAVCGHHPDGGPGGDPALVRACDCRKPAPGLLLDLIRSLDLDPAASVMIGDTEADLLAARRAGLRAALVRDDRRCELCPAGRAGAGEGAPPPTLPMVATPRPDFMAARIDQIARAILG